MQAKKGAEKLGPAKDAPDLKNSEKIEIETQQTKATSEVFYKLHDENV